MREMVRPESGAAAAAEAGLAASLAPLAAAAGIGKDGTVDVLRVSEMVRETGTASDIATGAAAAGADSLAAATAGAGASASVPGTDVQ